MNAEMKAKWLAALRSGKYKQGSGRLRSADGTQFCCLGVLADVAGANWDADGVPSVYGKAGCNGILNPDLCGIGVNVQRGLASKNDSRFYDFGRIANLIEVSIPATEQ